MDLSTRKSPPLLSSDFVLLVLVLIMGAILRGVCFGGNGGSDDEAYSRFAHQLLTTGFNLSTDSLTHFSLRPAVVFPVALLYRAFGVGELTMIAWPFVVSLLSVVLAYGAGSLLYGRRAALLAAVLQALVPIDVRMASELYPDLVASFFANIGILALYRSFLQPVESAVEIKTGVIAGLCFSLSWLCKELVVYTMPFVAGMLAWQIVYRQRGIRCAAAVACTLLGMLALEGASYYVMFGDPLLRFKIVASTFQRDWRWYFAEGSPYGWKAGQYWQALTQRLFVSGPQMIFLNPLLGLLPLTALVATAYSLLSGVRVVWFAVLWLAMLAAIFNFGSTNLHSYIPLTLTPRYLYPLILPSIVVLAGFVSGSFAGEFSFRRPRQALGIAMAVVLLVLTGLSAYQGVLHYAGKPESAAEREWQRLCPRTRGSSAIPVVSPS